MRRLYLASLAAIFILSGVATASAATPRCDGKRATIVRGDGGVTVTGTKGTDVIVTGAGDDVVRGAGARDRICSGRGDDQVSGGKGNDSIFAGPGDDDVDADLGRDTAQLGPGTDHAQGDRGNDTFNGGPGRDRLLGDLDDDKLVGGSGDDTIIGGLGADILSGGKGKADLLRGDRGVDTLNGGPGARDVASYSSASGRQGAGRLILEFMGNVGWFSFGNSGRAGVSVNLRLGIAAADGGGRDTLDDIEDLIGSPHADGLIGDNGANIIDGGAGDDAIYGQEPPPPFGIPEPPRKPNPGDVAYGGAGTDYCGYFRKTSSCGEPPVYNPSTPRQTVVYVDESIDGASLVVSAGPMANDIKVSRSSRGALLVRDVRGLIIGEGCKRTSGVAARCSARSRITHVGVSAGYNDDRVEIDESVPTYVSARLLGELGNDTLLGGRGGDIIEGGPRFGYDLLFGRGGNDALAATTGADRLNGGRGADLLIDDDLCYGHRFSGGPGVDSVSFARVKEDVTARIGGAVTGVITLSWLPEPFDSCYIPDHVGVDVEAFEGSPSDDVLYGNGDDNRIQGRRGDDRIYGMAGDDRLVGGGGVDLMDGGSGLDQFLAMDGKVDHPIRCGGTGRERLVVDPDDRIGRDCR